MTTRLEPVRGLAAVLAVGVCAIAHAEPPCNDGPIFVTDPNLPTSGPPNGAGIGDLNGDGLGDVVAALFQTDKLSVHFANPDGTFQPETLVDIGNAPTELRVIDLDGDGHLDVITSNQFGGDCTAVYGNGDGSFSDIFSIPAGSFTFSQAIGDFNGDGVLDVAALNAASMNVTVTLLAGRALIAAPPTTVALSGTTLRLDTADFNGDGFDDLVAGFNTNTVSVILSNGDGTFQPEQSYPVGDGPVGARVDDLNGDGAIDIVSVNFTSDDISILLNTGGGQFQAEQRVSVGAQPFDLVINDLDSDGAPDLAVINGGSTDTSILLGNGDGTFRDPVNYAVPTGPYSIASGDLDADGAPDLAVVNNANESVSVLFAFGDGTFRAQLQNSTGEDPYTVVHADFDGDGNLDLAIANSTDSDLSVMLGNGDGTFREQSRFGETHRSRSIDVADLNGDGHPDLVSDSWDSDMKFVSVFLGNGDGTFQNAIEIPTSFNSTSVAIADFNNDTNPDIALSISEILLGNGDGTFLNLDISESGAGAPGDLDHDNAIDLVRLGNDQIRVTLGNGDGTFLPGVVYPVGDEPVAVVVVDLNGDGDPDVAVANERDHDVGVLLGNGDGTLQAMVRYPVGDFPAAIAAGDLNADGITDLASCNTSSGMPNASDNLSVLLGNGDGTFSPAQHFNGQRSPRSLTIADFDGDGVSDIAMSGFDDKVTVYLNTTLAVSYWSGNGGQIFADNVNWAGSAPGLAPPNVAAFDATVPPGGFPPVDNVLILSDTALLALTQANQEIQLNLFGNDLTLLGDLTSSAGPIGLELGTEQCGSMTPLPPLPPTLRIDNTGSADGVVSTPRATVGRDGPAVLEINGLNGTARLDVIEDLVVGGRGDGLVQLRTDDSELTYGTSTGDSDSLIIGDRASGEIEVMNGARVSATDGLGLFLLGRAPGSSGAITIDGVGSTWDHNVLGADDLEIGLRGHGAVGITDGGVFNSQFGSINLGRFAGSSGEVTLSGPGSAWIDPISEMTIGGEGSGCVTVGDGAMLSIFGGITVSSNGLLAGAGTVTEVVNLGDLALGGTGALRGASPSSLTVIGDFDQFDDPANPALSGRLLVDLFDTGGSIGSDTLTVTGDAGLAGGLIIDSAAPLEPSGAAAVSVLNAGAVNGRFDVAFFPAVMPDPMTQEGRFLRLSYPSPAITGPGSISIEVATLSDIIDVDEDSSFDAGGTATFAASGDFDGDGDADLALAIPDGADPTGAAGVVTILTNGTVEGSPTLFIPAATVSYTVGVMPTGLAVAEFDGVAGMDIAVCNEMTDDVNVLTNDGAGLFAVSAPIAVGGAPSSIASSDFDGDGLADLVVTNSADATATVLLNTSTLTGERALTFAPAGPDLPTGPAPASVDPLDVDNGKDEDDIVIANAGDGTVTIYFNAGAGVFGSPVTMGVGEDPRRVAARDLNADGFPEIVTTNTSGDTVSVLVNNAGSAFAPSVDVPGGDGPTSLALVDLDGDADPDLALVTRNPSGERVVRILRNDLDDGQIAFAPSGEFLAGTGPLFVLADDFDGDAMADLITVNETTGVRGLVNDDVTFLKAAGPAACAGDCDGSGAVNFNDLVSMLFEFGNETAPPGCDADASGAVNFNDLVAALFLFGPCP